jgi:hypothetical protein
MIDKVCSTCKEKHNVVDTEGFSLLGITIFAQSEGGSFLESCLKYELSSRKDLWRSPCRIKQSLQSQIVFTFAVASF